MMVLFPTEGWSGNIVLIKKIYVAEIEAYEVVSLEKISFPVGEVNMNIISIMKICYGHIYKSRRII